MRNRHLQLAFKAMLIFSLATTLPQCAEIKDRAGHLFERTGALDSDPATASVTARSLNLRKGPSTQAAVLAVLEKGDRVRVEAQDGLWLSVVTRNGRKGWVHGKYLTGFEGLGREATGRAASKSAEQPGVESFRPSGAVASETADKGAKAVLFEDGGPLKPDRLPAVSEPPVETADPLFEDEPLKPPEPPSTNGAPFPPETSPLFEDEPVASAETPAPVDSSRPAPDPQLLDYWP